jgi:hypothetical protein
MKKMSQVQIDLRPFQTGPRGDPSTESSPLGAGGWQKAEIHHPPSLPQASRGCDHRHHARTGPAQTCYLWFRLFDLNFGIINLSHKKVQNIVLIFSESCLSMTCPSF